MNLPPLVNSSHGISRTITVALVFIVLALSFSAISPNAMADEAPAPVSDDFQTTPEPPSDSKYGDYLVYEGGEVILEIGGDRLGIQPLSTTAHYRGSSYVSTTHPHDDHLRYFGRAYAAGNIYQGQRVVSAGFKYSRDSGFDSGWKESHARVGSNCQWTPGPLVKYDVFDSLLPGASNTTKFNYRFGLVPSTLC